MPQRRNRHFSQETLVVALVQITTVMQLRELLTQVAVAVEQVDAQVSSVDYLAQVVQA